jgi:glycine/D-amino acid oxidase-like deaminating enzyme
VPGVKDYGSYSFWLETCGDDLTPRPTLPTSSDVDVAIVGGGYTGLWTAYYLARSDPSLRITVIDKEICGFGASGRNGGWCSALFAAGREKIARRYGRDAAIAMQRAMFSTVDEVGRACSDEGIDCHFHKGGTVIAATSPAHVARLRKEVQAERGWGFSEEDYRWLEPEEARAVIEVAGGRGAAFTPHCAALHPARLARGLARTVERLGVTIHELTPATEVDPRIVRTPSGDLRADVVIRATEGYTPLLPEHRRTLAPIYSLMIATEPLPDSFWKRVAWNNRETFADGRHLIIYAQRTAEDRIAFGGRGAPYHFGSSIDERFDREPRVFAELRRVLTALFPDVEGTEVTHTWGGPIGVPRDWFSSVGYDKVAGLAWAGGYVGDGVSTSNLAGRTLADLIQGRDTELVRLPWVGHRWRKWEPEPLRWLGINFALRAMASADEVEARTNRPARRVNAINKLIGM